MSRNPMEEDYYEFPEDCYDKEGNLKKMSPSIQALLEDLRGNGDDNLWAFYRSVYKYTPCGPMVGFAITGKWYYGSELPTSIKKGDVVYGISVGSIVEGSDVEIPPVVFESKFKPEEFWEAVDQVNAEASFYWERDNSTWFTFYLGDGTVLASGRTEQFDESIIIIEGEVPPEILAEFEEKMINDKGFPWGINCSSGEELRVRDYVVRTWLNESTWW